MPLMMMGSSGMIGVSGVAAIVSSVSLSSVGFFEIVWTIGMAAMMFPAMVPVVLFYNRVKTKLISNNLLAETVGTPLFLSGYLVAYALLGIVAFLAVYAALGLASMFPTLSSLAVIASSGVLIVTGLYQFTPLKKRCLSQCISPLGFFAIHSSSGLFGSLRMGLSHGRYCAGCCWAYMLVMLAVGAMSIPIMAALAGIIALEKVILRGSIWFNRAVAFGFIALGISVLLFPSLLMVLSGSM
jgi:predicted metal-binding membrane protein